MSETRPIPEGTPAVPDLATAMEKAPDRFAGTSFAERFRVEERLGTGGMGRVYRAWQIPMSRWVALKILDRSLAPDESTVRRFEREMRSAARVDHPNAVLVYEFGSSGEGDLYLAMELLRGHTLKHELQQCRALRADRIAHIAKQICQALACAHVENIVHRDVKPENVMLVDNFGMPDWVKVLDFGIAQVVRHTPGLEVDALTHHGQVVGTPEYMSPEQIVDGPVDHRSDLYSLGCVIYELATGRVPFAADEPMSVLYKHVNEEAPRLAGRGPHDQPPWLETVVQHLLTKDPDKRPASALEVVALIEEASTSTNVPYSRTVQLERKPPVVVPRRPAPDPLPVLVGALVGVGVVVGVLAALLL